MKKKATVTIGFDKERSKDRHKDDYYATEPRALEVRSGLGRFSNVWEPAVGGGHLASVLASGDILSRVSDISWANSIDSIFLDNGVRAVLLKGLFSIESPEYLYTLRRSDSGEWCLVSKVLLD